MGWHDFVTIMTWNVPILKVIRHVSESFLKRSTPNVNRLFSRSAPFLERNLLITLLDSRLGFFRQIKKIWSISFWYSVNSLSPGQTIQTFYPITCNICCMFVACCSLGQWSNASNILPNIVQLYNLLWIVKLKNNSSPRNPRRNLLTNSISITSHYFNQ